MTCGAATFPVRGRWKGGPRWGYPRKGQAVVFNVSERRKTRLEK